jgi:hypothetical protein
MHVITTTSSYPHHHHHVITTTSTTPRHRHQDAKRETVKTVKQHHDAKRDMRFLLYRTIPLKDEANSISHLLKKGAAFHLTIQTAAAMAGIVFENGSNSSADKV